MLELAEQIENPWPLWISPAQSTLCQKCGLRALVESGQRPDSIVYLLNQSSIYT